MRVQRLAKDRAYDRLASKELEFVKSKDKSKRAIMCIGAAGTGAGSRIKGHQRHGGGQMRRKHRRHATVAMTNERLTSQTCSNGSGNPRTDHLYATMNAVQPTSKDATRRIGM